jgi:hypothetical protein
MSSHLIPKFIWNSFDPKEASTCSSCPYLAPPPQSQFILELISTLVMQIRSALCWAGPELRMHSAPSRGGSRIEYLLLGPPDNIY